MISHPNNNNILSYKRANRYKNKNLSSPCVYRIRNENELNTNTNAYAHVYDTVRLHTHTPQHRGSFAKQQSAAVELRNQSNR